MYKTCCGYESRMSEIWMYSGHWLSSHRLNVADSKCIKPHNFHRKHSNMRKRNHKD